MASEAERFWSRVAKAGDDECWLWLGARGYGRDSGYGYGQWEGRSIGAHRIAVAITGRNVAEGMVVDHLCRNRLCVNPRHLDVVTPKENTLRGEGPTARNAAKTVCHKGHPLTGNNVIHRAGGWRSCRICKQETNQASKLKRRALARAAAMGGSDE